MTERTNPDAEWISPAEAASRLGVTPKTVGRYAEAGKIRSQRPGAHRRYSRADVEGLAS